MEVNTDDKVTHICGATTSKAPRFDLIPAEALYRLAQRFELGEMKHGHNNWRKGLDDDSYILERANHVIKHTLILMAKIQGDLPWDEDDDAAAISWGGAFLSEAVKKLGH
jgi:hypothetical protein